MSGTSALTEVPSRINAQEDGNQSRSVDCLKSYESRHGADDNNAPISRHNDHTGNGQVVDCLYWECSVTLGINTMRCTTEIPGSIYTANMRIATQNQFRSTVLRRNIVDPLHLHISPSVKSFPRLQVPLISPLTLPS
jgi:hypothetical protein